MAQAAFPFAQPLPHPALAVARTGRDLPLDLPAGLDPTGFQIGWDHAHHQLTPPLAHLQAESPVRHGWSAGRAVFGARTLKAGAAHRQWLALRLQAWQHGDAFEDVQVTPHFLGRIDSPVCPVLRAPLRSVDAQGPEATVQRLNPAAAYAAGNLACVAAPVAEARDSMDFDALHALALQVADGGPGHRVRGLDAAAWLRLAVLASFATPLPAGRVACLPLVLLPPNRVRVINPLQALQVMLTLQFTEGGYARRLMTLAALMPSSELRQAFQIFMHTLLARRLAAGQAADAAELRRALEDAWADPLVNRRWQRLALRLSTAQCETLLQRAQQRDLCVGGPRWMVAERATDGWALPVAAGPHASQAGPMPADQAEAGWSIGRMASAPSSARKRGSQKLAS